MHGYTSRLRRCCRVVIWLVTCRPWLKLGQYKVFGHKLRLNFESSCAITVIIFYCSGHGWGTIVRLLSGGNESFLRAHSGFVGFDRVGVLRLHDWLIHILASLVLVAQMLSQRARRAHSPLAMTQ